jgi:hypothetical protein
MGKLGGRRKAEFGRGVDEVDEEDDDDKEGRADEEEDEGVIGEDDSNWEVA